MNENNGSGPLVIRYSDEEYSSFDEVFLKVSGTVTKFSKPVGKRIKGSRMRKRKRISNVDIYYV